MVQCDTHGRASRHFGPAFPESPGFSQTGCVNAPLQATLWPDPSPSPTSAPRGPWCDLDRWEAAATEKGLVARRFGFERKSASFARPITPSTSSNPYFSINLRPNQLAPFGHGSNTGHSPGAAGVDARRATPLDPRLARWGLASCCQLDPSHPALVTRQDPGVEPCRSLGSSLSLSRLPAWPVLRSPLLERPGSWARLACVTCYEMLRFSAFSRIWKPRFSTQAVNQ